MNRATFLLRLPLGIFFTLALCLGCAGEDPGPDADPSASDAGVGVNDDAGASDDAGEAAATLETPSILTLTELNESDIGFGWIGAGQPSEGRVVVVVNEGARVITLRTSAEDPFDEQGTIEGLGGTFIRYATTPTDYDSVAFREGMYDLYDEQRALGGAVYLHCASSNRVGASWALYLAERLGLDAEDALARGRAAGLASLEGRVRGILGL